MKLKIISKFFVILILILFVLPSVNAENLNIWKSRSKEFWPNYMLFLNDRTLRKDGIYDELRDFFSECKTPQDFYNRIQMYVNESPDPRENDLRMNEFRLSKIVDSIKDRKATLWCQHQTFLFIAGIKAMFSHYDENLKRYVIDEECNDFKIEIWRGFDPTPPVYPWRSHIYLAIDVWNGTDTFEVDNKTVDKIEIDNWYNNFREFDKRNNCIFYPFFPAKLNSLLCTKQKII